MIIAPLTPMLKTSLSTDSLTSAAQIGVDYNRVDDDDIFSMLKRSSSTDSSTSATQIEVEYDGVDGSGSQLVKKLSKVKKPQRLNKIYKSCWFERTKLPDLQH